MIQRLKAIYRDQAFFPGILGIFVNPFYLARAGLSRAMGEMAKSLHGQLLDVGCGTKPYRRLFAVDSYKGLDIDSEVTRAHGVADYYYDGGRFPITDASFDSALCNQVLEHVFNPDDFLAEISRVLKPGGQLLLTIPFVWDEHEQPYDYARYSSFGLTALLERAGFEIVEHRKLGDDASILFQLANAYLYKITARLPPLLRLLIATPLRTAINILGLLARWTLPKNPDLFLDHVVLARKFRDDEGHPRG